jgi:hypothetical protein
MKVKNIRTAAELHADYAVRLAAVTGLNATDYVPTASGMAGLLQDTAERLALFDQNREVLNELAAHLDAVYLLSDSPHAKDVLRTVDNTLSEVVGELELH